MTDPVDKLANNAQRLAATEGLRWIPRKVSAKLAAMLVAIPGIRDVGLTTNGILLAEQPMRCSTRACGG